LHELWITFPKAFSAVPHVTLGLVIPNKNFGMAYIAIERGSISQTGFKLILETEYPLDVFYYIHWIAMI